MKITSEQREVLSKLVESFRECQKEIIPDYEYTNKEAEPRLYMMNQEQLEDYAYRTLKEALKNL